MKVALLLTVLAMNTAGDMSADVSTERFFLADLPGCHATARNIEQATTPLSRVSLFGQGECLSVDADDNASAYVMLATTVASHPTGRSPARVSQVTLPYNSHETCEQTAKSLTRDNDHSVYGVAVTRTAKCISTGWSHQPYAAAYTAPVPTPPAVVGYAGPTPRHQTPVPVTHSPYDGIGQSQVPLSQDTTGINYTPPATEEPLDRAVLRARLMWQNQDYAGAYPLFVAAAERGSAEAMYWVGRMAWEGKGRDGSAADAYLYLGRAVEAGYQPAEDLLDRVNRRIAAARRS